MKFKIVHDTPGRIRLRCGGHYFDKNQEKSLEKTISVSYTHLALSGFTKSKEKPSVPSLFFVVQYFEFNRFFVFARCDSNGCTA